MSPRQLVATRTTEISASGFGGGPIGTAQDRRAQHVPAPRYVPKMRLLRRNAIGMYAIYGAAIASGLIVTPIIVRALGKDGYGAWSLIGAATTYLAVLDLGVAPAIVRFAAEARGRQARDEVSSVASNGLVIYGAIGFLTLPVGALVVWLMPVVGHIPHRLLHDVRIA